MLCTWKWGLRLCADVSLTLQPAHDLDGAAAFDSVF
jgi:hypothetical protein